ncbi:MAG: DUF998 domain-containing protein [Chloroflexi bacterium]|nr:DUF998 domain-containing protein [Chloroflexota bacterium]
MNPLARPEMFKIAGIAGVIFGLIGVITPSLFYKGTKGQKYSFLNHFISELGEQGVSRFAWVFNLGMILAGVCIVIASLSLGLLLPGFWAKAGMVLGVATGIALSLVGVFPMNKMKGHINAATAFFRGGLLMVLFFSLAMVLQGGENPVVPRALGMVGMIPVLAFGIFLGLMWSVRNEERHALDTTEFDRPRVWKFAVSEWSIYFAFIFWILMVALVI